jgi:potassium/chloride transporter 9
MTTSFSTESSYQTPAFQGLEACGEPLFGLRGEDSRSLSPSEYVGMVCDTLKLQKNIGLCRHFHTLDKAVISRNFHYIDVWPINFLQPNELDPFDESSLFMMQLACIINMVNIILILL